MAVLSSKLLMQAVWFLEIVVTQEVSMHNVCVCPPPRMLITSGVIWHDRDPVLLAEQVLHH